MKFKRKIAAALAAVMAFSGIAAVAPVSVDAAALRPTTVNTMQVSNFLTAHANHMRVVDADLTIGTDVGYTDPVAGRNLQSIDLLIPASAISSPAAGGVHSFTLNLEGDAVMNPSSFNPVGVATHAQTDHSLFGTTLRPVPGGATTMTMPAIAGAQGFLVNPTLTPGGGTDAITGGFANAAAATAFFNSLVVTAGPTTVGGYPINALAFNATGTDYLVNRGATNESIAALQTFVSNHFVNQNASAQDSFAGANLIIASELNEQFGAGTPMFLAFGNMPEMVAFVNNAANFTIINGTQLPATNTRIVDVDAGTGFAGLTATHQAEVRGWFDQQASFTQGAMPANPALSHADWNAERSAFMVWATGYVINAAATFSHGTITGTPITNATTFPAGTRIGYTGRSTEFLTGTADTPHEIPFEMVILPGSGVQINVVQAHAANAPAGSVLRIPLIFRVTGDGDITLNITGGPMPGSREIDLTTVGFGVNFDVRGGVVTGRDNVSLNPIRARENGVGAFGIGDVTWIFSLPTNYLWNVPADFEVVMIGFGGGGVTPPTFTHWTQVNPVTNEHELVIAWVGMPQELNRPAATIELQNLQVRHRGVGQPVFAENVQVTARRFAATGAANLPARDNLNGMTMENARQSVLARTTAPAQNVSFNAVSFRDWGITLNAVPGAAGEVQDTISGRTLRAGFRPIDFPTAPADFEGAVRRIRIEEVVPDSVWGARNIELTLTDAEGNLLPYAKIAGLQLQSWAVGSGGGTSQTEAAMPVGFSGNATFHNRHNVAAVGAITNGEVIGGAGNIRGNVQVLFSGDGHSVQVLGLNVSPANRVRLEATVYISTDVNWEGDVYITMTDRGIGHWDDAGFVYPSPTIRVADVSRPFDLETRVTNIPHRAQVIPTADITLTERFAGALAGGRDVELGISEFGVLSGRTEIGFNRIVQHQVSVDGHANAVNRLAITSLPPVGAGSPIANFNITRASLLAPSAITLENVTVYVNQAVPVGTYGVIFRGDAILDNDAQAINFRSPVGGGAARQLAPSEQNFRRYGFGGLIYEPYINVTTPGYGNIASLEGVLRAEVGSHLVTVGNDTRAMTTEGGVATPLVNVDGRTFMPLRGIQQVFGGNISWRWATPDNTFTPGAAQEVTLVVGGRVVVFTTGSTAYTVTVNGSTYTHHTDAAGMPRNIGGSVFVPLGFIGQALGVEVTYEGHGIGQVIWFNNPTQGSPMTVPSGNGEPADDNGNGNGNGENGNGEEENGGDENGNGEENGENGDEDEENGDE